MIVIWSFQLINFENEEVLFLMEELVVEVLGVNEFYENLFFEAFMFLFVILGIGMYWGIYGASYIELDQWLENDNVSWSF